MYICIEFTKPNNKPIMTLQVTAENSPLPKILTETGDGEFYSIEYVYTANFLICRVFINGRGFRREVFVYLFAGECFVGQFSNFNEAEVVVRSMIATDSETQSTTPDSESPHLKG